MHPLGKVALASFAFGVVPPILLLLVRSLAWVQNVHVLGQILGLCCTLFILLSLPQGFLDEEIDQVSRRAGFLGAVFGSCPLIAILYPCFTPFAWYLGALSFFHFSEYLVTSIIRPNRLGLDSFLLDHSPAYKAAAVASWLEFFMEIYLFPELKSLNCVTWVGLGLCLVGELLRKGAMLTAGFHFDHLIRYEKEEGHQLITHGIYAYFRHPAYVGWFYWAIATQLILINPICLLAYIWASWMFFNARIFEEECTLLNFFGEEYIQYQNRVPTGLPFIKGYQYGKT
nr:EOG090X0CFU [Triops cancriformis]